MRAGLLRPVGAAALGARSCSGLGVAACFGLGLLRHYRLRELAIEGPLSVAVSLLPGRV
jgi:hypothetical protein